MEQLLCIRYPASLQDQDQGLYSPLVAGSSGSNPGENHRPIFEGSDASDSLWRTLERIPILGHKQQPPFPFLSPSVVRTSTTSTTSEESPSEETVGGDWQKWRENPLRKERGEIDEERKECEEGEEGREREKGRGRRRWWTRLMHNSCGCLPCIFSCLNIWIPRSLQYRESGLGKYSAAYSPSLFFLFARLKIPSSTSFDSIRVSGT